MTGEQQLEALLKKDRYQVLLLTCPATMPFSFASHPWFVVNRKGTISRWEIFWRPHLAWFMRWGHLHKDFYRPFQGIEMFYMSPKHFWGPGVLRGYVEGAEGSLAQKMVECVENSPETYRFCHRYRLRGPNSNTYAQWILDQFPECGLSLPWNAVGKSFAVGGLE